MGRAQHLEEHKAILRDNHHFHGQTVHTHWDAPRNVYQAWVGDEPFERAAVRAEFGTTEAGVLRRLRNRRAVPLTHSSSPAPEAATQESRPSPDMHVADAMESRRHERKNTGMGRARALTWFLFLFTCMLLGVITFLVLERHHTSFQVVTAAPRTRAVAPVVVSDAPEAAEIVEPRHPPPIRTRRVRP